MGRTECRKGRGRRWKSSSGKIKWRRRDRRRRDRRGLWVGFYVGP